MQLLTGRIHIQVTISAKRETNSHMGIPGYHFHMDRNLHPSFLCSLMSFLLQDCLHFIPFLLALVLGALDQGKFPDSRSCIFLLL